MESNRSIDLAVTHKFSILVFQRKRRLHPIDALIEFIGFAVGAVTCEYPS
jgi:hypothetical protein